jgi:hypothetical protein
MALAFDLMVNRKVQLNMGLVLFSGSGWMRRAEVERKVLKKILKVLTGT